MSELAWWQRGAIYQIYPRSFNDANGDGMGDLQGIRDRLDHLEALGVEAIWLSPFYPSPQADFGYDVADYCDVDPTYGTLADFDALVADCHERGIKVVIDWVPNHSSDRHPWFTESRASRDSPKRDWYVWRDGKPDGSRPNDWESAFKACGPAWSFDEATQQWYLHSFMPEQPDLNWDHPDVEAAMHDTLRFWLGRGVDGFRMDVVFKISKDPELRDNADTGIAHHEDWEGIAERLQAIRAVVDEYDDRMIVGEVYLLDLERLLAYVNTGDQLHLAHNFVFLQLPWDAGAYRDSITEFERLSTEHVWPCWFLTNHDHSRVATRFDDAGLGQARARAVGVMLYALRGTPFVFEGEELGLPDAHIPPDRVVDVDGRDPERAPIPWTADAPSYGFTTGDAWLPFVDDAATLNAATQERDPDSTLHLYRRLADLRREEPVLQAGTQALVDLGPVVLAWRRELDGTTLLAAVNFATGPVALDVPDGAELVLSSDAARDALTGELAAAEAVLLRV